MKNFIFSMLICFSITSLCAGAASESILIVKLYDRAKEITYKLMTPEEYKALQKELKLEAKLYQKAVTLARKEWQANKETAKKPFSMSAIPLRKATVKGMPYIDREKADDKLAKYEDKEFEKTDKKKKSKGKLTKREEKKAKHAREKEYINQQIRALFESKLDELKQKLQQKEAE